MDACENLDSARIKVEICCDGIEAARKAFSAGADRIELCRDLSVGGVTPSREDILSAVAAAPCPVHVLIRPRGGDFNYSEAEIRQMLDDIRFCGEAGAGAVVIGALTPRRQIDGKTGGRLVEAARENGLGVTWHRSIDATPDPLEALEDVIALGVDRVLTSGGAASAWKGRDTLAEMAVLAEQRFLENLETGRITDKVLILPGCGITAANVRGLVAVTGVSEVHGSRLEILNALRATPLQNNGQ